MARPVKRGYVPTRFGQTHFYRADPAVVSDRPPLVCFHMSPWSAVVFEQFVAEMGEDRITVALDTPGYGDSDPPPDQPSMDDYAGTMADAVDALGFETYDVFGERTGAKIALALNEKRSDQIGALVLVSPVIWTDEERAQRRQFPLETVSPDGSHLAPLWRLSAALGAWGRPLERLGDVFYARIIRQDIAHYSRRAAAEFNARRALTNTRQPVLVMHPNDDLRGFAPRAEPLLSHPSSQLVDLPDWGYGFIETKAQDVAALVREFLDQDI